MGDASTKGKKWGKRLRRGKGLRKGGGKRGRKWPYATGLRRCKDLKELCKCLGGWKSSSSDVSSNSSSSVERRHMRDARRVHRQAMREARNRYKKDRKAAKHAF